LSFKFQLDWTYRFGDIAVVIKKMLAFWLENAYSGQFLVVSGDFAPEIVVSLF